MRWLTALLRMVQNISSTTPVVATFTRSLNLEFYPNGKADGRQIEEIWAGMFFQSVLVGSSTLGSMDWRRSDFSPDVKTYSS
jgi:hypothetical protein